MSSGLIDDNPLNPALKRGCFFVRDVANPRSSSRPVVEWGTHCEAVLLVQGTRSFHPVHYVIVAHLVLIRRTYSGDPFPVTNHRASSSQNIATLDSHVICNWIEHLWLHWIFFCLSMSTDLRLYDPFSHGSRTPLSPKNECVF